MKWFDWRKPQNEDRPRGWVYMKFGIEGEGTKETSLRELIDRIEALEAKVNRDPA